jgi:hypothetical protein
MATSYGLGAGTAPTADQSRQQQDYQALQAKRDINRQKQTQYASQNGMNTGGTMNTGGLPNTGGTGSSWTSPFAQKSAGQVSGTGTSPVSADGKIQQQQAPAPQPLQAGPGVGWVPQDHPMYGQPGYVGYVPPAQQQPAAGAAGQTPQSWGPPVTPWRQGPGDQTGQSPTLRTEAYHQPSQITQFGGSYNSGLEEFTENALRQAIAGGGGLPVEQLKGRARDDAFAMRGDNISSLQDAMAARGRQLGGWGAGQERNIRADTTSDILGKYRDVDIADAQSRLDNQYKGIELGNTYLQGQSGRRESDYKTGLEGQLAQDKVVNEGAANERDNFLALLQRYGIDKSADTATGTANIGAEANKYASRMGLIGDILRTMESGRGTDMGTGLGWAQTFMGGLR